MTPLQKRFIFFGGRGGRRKSSISSLQIAKVFVIDRGRGDFEEVARSRVLEDDDFAGRPAAT